ncbi:MAG: hypothetical protein KO202_07595 [Methanobacteriaceae archaeon]|nr:hypothetical protein [Methanobacteriaceae archaeon]
MDDIYFKYDEMTLFKGFYTISVDVSIIEIPNVPLTRKEFEIPDNKEIKSPKSSAIIYLHG